MQVKAEVIDNFEVSSDYYLLSLFAPDIANSAKPGQFVHIRCQDTFHPLLRRPFSFNAINPNEGIVKLLYEIRGIGTKIISSYSSGDYLDVLGPLGNGFMLEGIEGNAVLVGGGIGAAPLSALAQELNARKVNPVTVLLGAPKEDKLVPFDFFSSHNARVWPATDDGSRGHHGFVTDLLAQAIHESGNKCTVFACGPYSMLQTTGRISDDFSIPCQLSMDTIIACGVGACHGCAITTYKDGKRDHVRCCKEGPIFSSREVEWVD